MGVLPVLEESVVKNPKLKNPKLKNPNNLPTSQAMGKSEIG
jgi:hypothetical protein